MSLDYNKSVSKRTDQDNFWAAYADLYTMLTAIFLLLYVVASLRGGTNAIQQQIEQKQLAAEAADLKEQIRVYNTLKDDFVEKKATEDEQKTYKELMDKLSLLQDKAKEEKQELRKRAEENEKKEVALNKYQQIIRNIINANMLAKSGLKTRDEKIATKTQKIASLGQEIDEKTRTLAETEAVLNE
jgi:hypothetical protein